MMIVDALKRLFGRWRYRDAVSGHYVTKEYAKANPATTVRERTK